MDNALYIITGCTGYVGNAITKKLMQNGKRVIGLARDKDKAARVFGSSMPDIVYGDIRNPEDVERLFAPEGPYVVIHTAAMVTIGEGDKTELFDVNVKGTQIMVDAAIAHGAIKFLHTSSTEGLPKGWTDEYLNDYYPIPEKTRKGYSLSKSLADKVVLDAVKSRGLNACLLMLAGVLGPGDYSVTHMTQMIKDYIEGKLPASVQGGYNDFDIRDFTDVLDRIISDFKPGETYVFANRPDEINEVLSYVSEKEGVKKLSTLPLWLAYVGLPFLFVWSKISGKRPLYTASALASLKENASFPIGKAAEQFGYSPRPLKETVCDHVDFMREAGIIK